MASSRHFVVYSHPSQFQDREHRRQVWSYTSARTSWPQRRTKLVPRHRPGHFSWTRVEERERGEEADRVRVTTTVVEKRVMGEVERLVGRQVDAFHRFPIEDKDYILKAINHFCTVFAPSQMMAPVPQEKNTTNPILGWILPLMLADRMACESIVALTLKSVMNPQADGTVLHRAFLRHQSTAMKMLHGRFESPDTAADDSSINCIFTFIATDLIGGDIRRVEIHIKGLRRVVAIREKSSGPPLSGFLKALIQSVEVMAAGMIQGLEKETESETSPETEPHRETVEKDSDASEESMLKSLPKGFRKMKEEGQLSSEMVKALHMVQSLLEEQKEIVMKTASPDQLDKAGRLNVEMQQLRSVDDLSGIEKLVTVALSSYRHGIYNRCDNPLLRQFLQGLSDTEISKALATHLSETLDAALVECQGNEASERCLIWTAVVIGGTQTSDHRNTPARKDVLRRILARYSIARDWNGLKELLQEFFWDDELSLEWHDSWLEASQ